MFRLLTDQSLKDKLGEFLPASDAISLSSEFFSSLDPSKEIYIVIDTVPDQQDVMAVFTQDTMAIKFATLFPGAFIRSCSMGLIDDYKTFSERPRLVELTNLETYLKKIILSSEGVKRLLDSVFDLDDPVDEQAVWFVTDFTDVLYKDRDIVAMFTDFDMANKFTVESPTRIYGLVGIDFIDEYREVAENEWNAYNLSVLENGNVEFVEQAKTFEVPSNTMYNIVKTQEGEVALLGREGTFFAPSESEAIAIAHQELMDSIAGGKELGGYPGEED